jgi:hypothetical protein
MDPLLLMLKHKCHILKQRYSVEEFLDGKGSAPSS